MKTNGTPVRRVSSADEVMLRSLVKEDGLSPAMTRERDRTLLAGLGGHLDPRVPGQERKELHAKFGE